MNALDVANYIVSSGKVPDLTPLKLQKLLYYVYGVYWKEAEKRLFKENFVAWKLGPVVKSVYDAYRGYGSSVIDIPAKNEESTGNVGEETKKIIDPVLEVFGAKSSTELVALSHLTDPWIEAFRDPINEVIYPERIHKYFEEAFV